MFKRIAKRLRPAHIHLNKLKMAGNNIDDASWSDLKFCVDKWDFHKIRVASLQPCNVQNLHNQLKLINDIKWIEPFIPYFNLLDAFGLECYFVCALHSNVKKQKQRKKKNLMHKLFRCVSVAAVAEWYGYRIVACFVTSSILVPLKTHRVGQRCTYVIYSTSRMSNYSERSFSFNTSGSSSPLPSPIPTYRGGSTAVAKRSKFLRRLFYFKHMDFEFALWQMFNLFVSPQKVYRNFQYRKQTKNQFARDDPAFLVLLGFWLIVSSIGFAVVLKLQFISNRYLRKPVCKDQDVEWAYAFDVHLNAFFPLLIILHIFQLFFYHNI
ncbi:UNVERIFIED_CONTAM: unc50-b [Trichonephila clavipes]